MAALLMAIVTKGMGKEETAALTQCMTESGDVLDLSGLPGIKVDKHSTGGVGDGTSLVLAPLVASAGIIVPMMSGRGLGHTGGTLDKLESIPGFRVTLSPQEMKRQLSAIGVAMIGQTDTIAPADRKLYALRDVTATVDSIPLIAASIMSKKLAEGCDALLLDVKTGSGAFMRDRGDAVLLAQTMTAIGRGCGKTMKALVTDMNRPLGNEIGNALEVRQAIEVLKGGGPGDLTALISELAARMLMMGGKASSLEEGKAVAHSLLSSGKALEKFRQLITAQGGDPAVIDTPEQVLPRARCSRDIVSGGAGYISSLDTRALGCACVVLGAGRAAKDDVIDPAAGMSIMKKTGDSVSRGELLATLHYSEGRPFAEAEHTVRNAYHISSEPPEPLPLIYEEL